MILKKPIKVTHIKTGNQYKVIGVVINATNTHDGADMIMYQELTTNSGIHYVRDVMEFQEKFEGLDLKELAQHGYIITAKQITGPTK